MLLLKFPFKNLLVRTLLTCRKRRWNDDRNQIYGLQEDLPEGDASMKFQDHRIDEATAGDDCETLNEAVDMAIELKVDWLRKQNGSNQLSLGGQVAGSNDHRLDKSAVVEPGLNDRGTAVQRMFSVLLDVVELSMLGRDWRFGDRHRLSGQHRFVHDHVTWCKEECSN